MSPAAVTRAAVLRARRWLEVLELLVDTAGASAHRFEVRECAVGAKALGRECAGLLSEALEFGIVDLVGLLLGLLLCLASDPIGCVGL